MSTVRTQTDQPWLHAYPPEMPATFTAVEPHLLAHFRDAVASAGDREAIRYFDASLTYAEVDRLSDGFALWLMEQGVKPGDRVGIILQNVPHVAIAVLATWKLTAIPVPGNPMYQPRELTRIFADYEPAAVICHDDHAVVVRQALLDADLAATPCATVRARDFQTSGPDDLLPPDAAPDAQDFLTICTAHAGRQPPPAPIRGEDLGLLLYTSGTTGVPKGAMIRHSSIAFDSEVSALLMRLGADSRVLAIAPMFHITGFIVHLGVAIASRCSMAVHYRFRSDIVLDVIRNYRPTFTVGAITAFNALMNAEGVTREDFGSFEQVFCGGAPIAPALRAEVKDRLGITLQPAYGMTETCGITHLSPPGMTAPVDPDTGAMAVGLPISSTEARIVGPEGEDLPPGSAGEIWMRGPQIMTGYWNKPDDTAETLHDGWMRSGDIGCMDENGWFYVVDRQKDMISASGFKVWPREVEDVLLEHVSVREAAVIGVPHPYRGETVVAYISRTPGSPPAEAADLIRHCRERLAAYKVPARVEIMDELPKTPTGKIQRAALRQTSADGAQK